MGLLISRYMYIIMLYAYAAMIARTVLWILITVKFSQLSGQGRHKCLWEQAGP